MSTGTSERAQHQCMRAGLGVSDSHRRLVVASRLLLEAVIFHPAHLEALAAVASMQHSSKHPENAAEPPKAAKRANDDEVPADEGGQSHAPTYVSLIFQVTSSCTFRSQRYFELPVKSLHPA